ncbi:MAG: terminase [Actinomycetes bacterium]
MPPRRASAGQEAVQLAASAGLHLDPWQADVLDGALGERPDGKWAASEVGLIVPRQNGKGAVLEAKALHSLFLAGSRLILWSAHEFKTAREGFLRVRHLIDNTDDLRRRVARVRAAHGEEGIELLSGARLNFLARSRGSGRGFSGDDVLFDEAYALNDEQMSAMLPTLSARPNPQVWYTSSAPLPGSAVLRRLCLRGRAGGKGLAYAEWCALRRAVTGDRRALAAANPGLGIRLTLESAERELGAMSDEDYRRERLGIWREDEVEAVIDAVTWAGLVDQRQNATATPAFGVDVTPDYKWATIAAATRWEDRKGHVEVVDRRPGTRWVVERLAELDARWHPCATLLDPRSPAGTLLPDLAEAGVKVEAVNGTELAQACGAFFDAAMSDELRHLDQPELNAALEVAATRPLGDAWAWTRRGSEGDISPLVAVTLALYGYAVWGPQTYDALDNIW